MPKAVLNSPAPDFVLQDYQGNRVQLSAFEDRQNVLLVFNRGFTWPFCRRHMAQLRQDYTQFEQRDTVILVVGPESADKFADYFVANGLPFTGLPDPKHSVLKQYGQEVNLFKLGRMPAQVVVDKQGVVRFAYYGQSMRDIPDNDELLALLDEMNTSAPVELEQAI